MVGRKIKVAFLMPQIIMGGVETCLLRLITCLKSYPGYEFTVITKKTVVEEFFLKEFQEKDIPLVTFDFDRNFSQNKLWFLSKTISRLRRSFHKRKKRRELLNFISNFDLLIDYHNLSFYNEIKNVKVPKIGWVHFNREIFDHFYAKQQDDILNFYQNVVCLSQSFYQLLINRDTRWINQLVQIYNPIDIRAVQERASIASHPEDEKFFVFVARIDNYQKDHLTVIKAFKIFVSKYTDAKIYFIGDGPGSDHFKKITIENGLEKNIIFLGTLDNPLGYMKYACANILSSFFEGLPTVLIEGACLGVLNISSYIFTGGTDDILLNGEAGILFPVGDVKKLAQIFESVWTGRVDASGIINNATRSLVRFDKDIIASQVKQLIDNTLKISKEYEERVLRI